MAKSKKEPEVTEEENAEVEAEAKKETKTASTKEVVFNTNVTLGENFHEKGVKVKISAEDYKAIQDAGVIEE